jgi:hypothetical protein
LEPLTEVDMSYQARRLRVQLHSGESVVFDEPGITEDAAAADEKIVKGVCIDPASWRIASCLDDFTWYLLVKSAAIESLSAEQLPVLRSQLEARLKEIDAAEQ